MDGFVADSSIDLLQLTGLQDLQSLAIIGLSKNAGKTTCLNHIVAAWQDSAQSRPLALTSIGRDGESEDILSGYEKPRIYVPTGTLIATAEGALQQSDALLEILELSKIRTALGEVIVCRALSDGYVEFAGPSAAEDIGTIENLMRQHEPKCLFIIDGASVAPFASRFWNKRGSYPVRQCREFRRPRSPCRSDPFCAELTPRRAPCPKQLQTCLLRRLSRIQKIAQLC